MGFWSSVGSAISSGFSAVCGAVSSGLSAIGSAVSSFASSVSTVIATTIEALAPIAEAIGKFANALLQGLGIIKPDEDIEEFGDRALQAAAEGITPDKYENFEDYIEELRNFELDPEKSAKTPKTVKLTSGLALGTVGVEKKFDMEKGSLNGVWFLPMANPEYFTSDRVQGMLEAGRLGGSIFEYLEDKLSLGDEVEFIEKLSAGLDQDEQKELYQELDIARENHDNLAKDVELAMQNKEQSGE